MPDMGASAWAVYTQLARHADRHGHCFPGIRYLAKLTRLDKGTVVTSIKRLVRLRLVTVQKRNGQSTHYLVRHRE
jgi:DNA-binding MarR family transcriptional regulator